MSDSEQPTSSDQASLGIVFRETMAGGFSMGETDPRTGEQRGKNAGTTLAMHASVGIPDLARFIADPEHAGTIVGSISYPPLAEHLASKSGKFNLFSPSDNPKLKLMIYELGFEHAGVNYYLAGKKEVRDDPGVDLWKDTTTLYVLLHQGADPSGPVVGAGVLTLSTADLIKLALTVRVTNAGSPQERAQALVEFGRFFMGELWDQYAKFFVAPWWRRAWWRLFGTG